MGNSLNKKAFVDAEQLQSLAYVLYPQFLKCSPGSAKSYFHIYTKFFFCHFPCVEVHHGG